jgi:ribosomal protein S18 acetylase RimI-like enzyme
MAVLDAHHGKGLARLLMSAVVEDARAGGIRRLAADTLAENAAARRLFRAIGGHATGRDGHVVSYAFDADTVAGRLAAITPGKAMDDLRQAFASQRMRRSA